MTILEMSRYYCAIAITYGRTSTFVVGVSLQTIATIAIDRYLAVHLRLRYRELVNLRRLVCILVIERIATAVWSGSWFLSVLINMYSGAVGLFSFCLIIPLCYFSIYRSLCHHVAQTHLNLSSDFDVAQYKKTVNSMLWSYGLLLVCYMPHLTSLLVILFTGLNTTFRFPLHVSGIAVFLIRV